MAATVVDELVIKVAADMKGLEKQLSKTQEVVEKQSRKMQEGFKRVGDNVTKLTRGPMTGLVKKVVALGAAFVSVRAVVDSFARADSLAKTADRLGLTTEALAGLRFAAEQTGVATSMVDNSLQRMNRRLADAANEAGPAAAQIKKLGLNAEDLMAMRPEQAFATIADSINQLGTTSEKTAAAFAFFDTEGGKLLNTMALGADGLAEMQEEAEALGIAMSRIEAARIEAANDAINRAKKAFQGVTDQLAIALAPAFHFVADAITDSIKASVGFGKASERVGEIVVAVLGTIKAAWNGLQVLIAGSEVVVAGLSVAFMNLADNAIRGAQSIARWFKLGMGVAVNAVINATRTMITSIGQVAAFASSSGVKGFKDIGEAAEGARNTALVALGELQMGVADTFADDGAIATGFEGRVAIAGDLLGSAMDRFRQAVADAAVTDPYEAVGISWDEFLAVQEERQAQLTAVVDKGNQDRTTVQSKWLNKQLSEEQQVTQAKLAAAATFFGALSSLTDTENRKLFEIGKVASIANAIVNTAQGVTNALATIPPPASFAVAGAIGAAGAVQIAKIQSTQFGGGGSGGGAVGGGGGGGGVAPSASAPASSPAATSGSENAGATTNFNVTLEGERFGEGQVRELMGMINEQTGSNFQLNATGLTS